MSAPTDTPAGMPAGAPAGVPADTPAGMPAGAPAARKRTESHQDRQGGKMGANGKGGGEGEGGGSIIRHQDRQEGMDQMTGGTGRTEMMSGTGEADGRQNTDQEIRTRQATAGKRPGNENAHPRPTDGTRRQGIVRVNGVRAGILEELGDRRFRFTYDRAYLARNRPAVSLSLPVRAEPYIRGSVFPAFSGLLAEGTLADIQCHALHLDQHDVFGRILATCRDTIGAVTVEPLEPGEAEAAVSPRAHPASTTTTTATRHPDEAPPRKDHHGSDHHGNEEANP